MSANLLAALDALDVVHALSWTVVGRAQMNALGVALATHRVFRCCALHGGAAQRERREHHEASRGPRVRHGHATAQLDPMHDT